MLFISYSSTNLGFRLTKTEKPSEWKQFSPITGKEREKNGHKLILFYFFFKHLSIPYEMPSPFQVLFIVHCPHFESKSAQRRQATTEPAIKTQKEYDEANEQNTICTDVQLQEKLSFFLFLPSKRYDTEALQFCQHSLEIKHIKHNHQYEKQQTFFFSSTFFCFLFVAIIISEVRLQTCTKDSISRWNLTVIIFSDCWHWHCRGYYWLNELATHSCCCCDFFFSSLSILLTATPHAHIHKNTHLDGVSVFSPFHCSFVPLVVLR